MTPTKKEPRQTHTPVEATNRSADELPKEPVTLNLLDMLLGDCDAEVRDMATDTGSWIERMFDVARNRSSFPLPPVVSMGAHLRDTIDDIRFLIGGGAKVGLVVVMSDRHRFDSINLPGQVEAGCDEHGLRVKVFSDDDLKIVLMNVVDRTPPMAHTGQSQPRMRQPEEGDCQRVAHF